MTFHEKELSAKGRLATVALVVVFLATGGFAFAQAQWVLVANSVLCAIVSFRLAWQGIDLVEPKRRNRSSSYWHRDMTARQWTVGILYAVGLVSLCWICVGWLT